MLLVYAVSRATGQRSIIISSRTVSIIFSGPLADADGLEIGVAFSAAIAFRYALREMIRYGWSEGIGPGAPPYTLRAASALTLVSVTDGGRKMTFRIAPPDAGESGADSPLAGLKALIAAGASGASGSKQAQVPPIVAWWLRELPDRLPDGIDAISIVADREIGGFTMRRPADSKHTKPLESKVVTCDGHLEAVNWSCQTAQLGTVNGVVLLRFPARMMDDMRDAARKSIAVTGVGHPAPGGLIAELEVHSFVATSEASPVSELVKSEEYQLSVTVPPVDWIGEEWDYDDRQDLFETTVMAIRYADRYG